MAAPDRHATSAAEATRVGTPEATERLDPIGGTIAGLARRPGATASRAARRLGSRAIVAACELDPLHTATPRKHAAPKNDIAKGDGAVA